MNNLTQFTGDGVKPQKEEATFYLVLILEMQSGKEYSLHQNILQFTISQLI